MSPCWTACSTLTSAALAAGIGVDTSRVSSEMLPEKVQDATKRIMLLKSENTRLRMQIQVSSTGSQFLWQVIVFLHRSMDKDTAGPSWQSGTPPWIASLWQQGGMQIRVRVGSTLCLAVL